MPEKEPLKLSADVHLVIALKAMQDLFHSLLDGTPTISNPTGAKLSVSQARNHIEALEAILNTHEEV